MLHRKTSWDLDDTKTPVRVRACAWFAIAALAACGMTALDEPVGHESSVEQEVFAYHPMGFARVSAAGGLVTRFNSAGGAVTTTHEEPGNYTLRFEALGTTSPAEGALGNVQVTAEGTGNARCDMTSWGGAPRLHVSIVCTAPDGTQVDSPFAVLYIRDVMPAPSAAPASAAYMLVGLFGDIARQSNYNSSGHPNSVVRTGPGQYALTIPHGATSNASVIVTPATFSDRTNTCSVVDWTASSATVQCRDLTGALADTSFSFSYSVSGPARDQQGAHARFNGVVDRAAALGRVSWCSPAAVRGSRIGSLTSMVVEGDLGSWDGGPFLRASMVTKVGAPGYCKVESVTSAGAPPSTTSTTTVRCYTPQGVTIAVPAFAFTHLTSDAIGPC